MNLRVDLTPDGILTVAADGAIPAALDKYLKAIPGRRVVRGGYEWGYAPFVLDELQWSIEHCLEYGVTGSYSTKVALVEAAAKRAPSEATGARPFLIPWQSPTAPYEHQLAFKRWRRGGGQPSLLHPACLLEAGAGLGKTLMAIEEMLEFKARWGYLRALVLARNSNLEDPWAEQLPVHGPSLGFVILNGTRKSRLAQLATFKLDKLGKPVEATEDLRTAEVYVHSHEDLPAMGRWLTYLDWDIIVLDETSRFRTAAAARVGLLTGNKSRVLEAPVKLAMSARPVIKNTADVYPVMKWLGAPTGNKAEFIERHMIMGGWGDKEELALRDVDTLNETLDCYRFVIPKKTVLNLPRAWHYERLDLRPWQRAVYKRVQRELVTKWLDEKDTVLAERSILNHLGELLRLAEVTAGFESIGDDRYRWRDDNTKAEHLFNNVLPEYEGEQVILYAHFKPEVANLNRMAKEHGRTPVMFFGGQTEAANTEAKRTFQAGEADLLIANMGKAAHGLNLPSAHTSIYYTRNLGDTDGWGQSLERNSRLNTELADGETLNVVVLECRDTVDEKTTATLGDDIRKAARITTADVEELLGL